MDRSLCGSNASSIMIFPNDILFDDCGTSDSLSWTLLLRTLPKSHLSKPEIPLTRPHSPNTTSPCSRWNIIHKLRFSKSAFPSFWYALFGTAHSWKSLNNQGDQSLGINLVYSRTATIAKTQTTPTPRRLQISSWQTVLNIFKPKANNRIQNGPSTKPWH